MRLVGNIENLFSGGKRSGKIAKKLKFVTFRKNNFMVTKGKEVAVNSARWKQSRHVVLNSLMGVLSCAPKEVILFKYFYLKYGKKFSYTNYI